MSHPTRYFCIGLNRTGTTSLAKAFSSLGFNVAPETIAGHLLHAYKAQDLYPIYDFCKYFSVFQDVPFSLPGIYRKLDEIFPNSRFILTLRDSPEQWYESFVGYFTMLFGGFPTVQQLEKCGYIYPGFFADAIRAVMPIEDVLDKAKACRFYEAHEKVIRSYFSGRPDFLVLNVAQKGDYQKFCSFVGVESAEQAFPWENKRADLKSVFAS